MLKFIILLIALPFQNALSQKNYTKDYATVDSLTKTLRTYAIEVLINDSLIPNQNSIATEVVRAFTFLSEKKKDKTAPDFFIKIKIAASLIDEPRSIYIRKDNMGTTYEGKIYKIVCGYKYNVIMEVVTKNNPAYNIVIASDNELQTTFNKTIYDKPEEIPFLRRSRWTANDLDFFIDSYKANFPRKIDLFTSDFRKVIKMYKG